MRNEEKVSQTDEIEQPSTVQMATEKTESAKEEEREDDMRASANRSRKQTPL